MRYTALQDTVIKIKCEYQNKLDKEVYLWEVSQWQWRGACRIRWWGRRSIPATVWSWRRLSLRCQAAGRSPPRPSPSGIYWAGAGSPCRTVAAGESPPVCVYVCVCVCVIVCMRVSMWLNPRDNGSLTTGVAAVKEITELRDRLPQSSPQTSVWLITSHWDSLLLSVTHTLTQTDTLSHSFSELVI